MWVFGGAEGVAITYQETHKLFTKIGIHDTW